MSNHKQDTLPRLGRGLEALIPKSFIGAGKTILQLPVKDVFANTYQPRTVFSEYAIAPEDVLLYKTIGIP